MSNNPNQLQIEFFWPLTEQIPLDLNYEGCARPVKVITVPVDNGGTAISYQHPTWTTTATFQGAVETPELVIKLDKKPNIVVRWLYKLINIKWKLK